MATNCPISLLRTLVSVQTIFLVGVIKKSETAVSQPWYLGYVVQLVFLDSQVKFVTALNQRKPQKFCLINAKAGEKGGEEFKLPLKPLSGSGQPD